MPDENRRVDDSAEISQLLADERIPRLGSLLHLPEIFFGGVLSRQRNDLLGDTITSRIGFSPIWNAFITSSRRSSDMSPSSSTEPSRFRRSARDSMTSSSVSSHAPVISTPKSLSVSFAMPSPSVMTGEMIQWNQYSGAAPYRQTSRDRSTPRYVGVCSPWVR